MSPGEDPQPVLRFASNRTMDPSFNLQKKTPHEVAWGFSERSLQGKKLTSWSK